MFARMFSAGVGHIGWLAGVLPTGRKASARVAERRPLVIVGRGATPGEPRHPRRSAHQPAPGQLLDHPARIRLGRQTPIRLPRHPPPIAQRARHARSKIRAGLHQQYRPRARPRKARRDDASRRPAAHHHNIEGLAATDLSIGSPGNADPPSLAVILPDRAMPATAPATGNDLLVTVGYCSQTRSGHARRRDRFRRNPAAPGQSRPEASDRLQALCSASPRISGVTPTPVPGARRARRRTPSLNGRFGAFAPDVVQRSDRLTGQG